MNELSNITFNSEHRDGEKLISIVIPVFNEEDNLPALYEQLTSAAQHWPERYEVIVVDDCSGDTSPQLLAKLHAADPRWKVLRFSRNFGHQLAVSAGIHYSNGDAIAVIDGDLQDPPEIIAQLIAQWRQGYDVVYAVRKGRKENVLLVASYAIFYRLLQRMASIEIPLDSGDFCLMDRCVVDVLKAMPERNRFVRGLRSWAGFRQIGVEYERAARYGGKPKYTLRKLVHLAIDGLISFSTSPLRIASFAGTAMCGLSAILIFLLTIWWISGVAIVGMQPRDSVGWTSIVCLQLLLSGLTMLILGITGEYLACMFDEVKGRPPWIIAHARGFDFTRYPGERGWFAKRPVAPDPPSTCRDEVANRE